MFWVEGREVQSTSLVVRSQSPGRRSDILQKKKACGNLMKKSNFGFIQYNFATKIYFNHWCLAAVGYDIHLIFIRRKRICLSILLSVRAFCYVIIVLADILSNIVCLVLALSSNVRLLSIYLWIVDFLLVVFVSFVHIRVLSRMTTFGYLFGRSYSISKLDTEVQTRTRRYAQNCCTCEQALSSTLEKAHRKASVGTLFDKGPWL